jgi:hypothetical protein
VPPRASRASSTSVRPFTVGAASRQTFATPLPLPLPRLRTRLRGSWGRGLAPGLRRASRSRAGGGWSRQLRGARDCRIQDVQQGLCVRSRVIVLCGSPNRQGRLPVAGWAVTIGPPPAGSAANGPFASGQTQPEGPRCLVERVAVEWFAVRGGEAVHEQRPRAPASS